MGSESIFLFILPVCLYLTNCNHVVIEACEPAKLTQPMKTNKVASFDERNTAEAVMDANT